MPTRLRDFRTLARFWRAHDTAALTEAFRRAVLRFGVRRRVFEREEVKHSGHASPQDHRDASEGRSRH